MGTNISIKNVSEPLVERLRARAKRHHRSMQGELLAILEEVLAGRARRLTVAEARRRLEELGLRTGSESAEMVREERDAR